MSRQKLSRNKNIRHPNFFQRHHKGIGVGLIFIGLIELIITGYLIFLPDPVISPIPLSFQGKRPALDDSSVIALKKMLSKYEISYDQIYTTKEGDYIIKLNPDGEVLLNQNAASLQLVLARITMEGKRFSRLDFRFEKPVIVFK